MLFIKKNKLKLSIIEDYIQVLAIDNFFNNDFSSFHHSFNNKTFNLVKQKHLLTIFQYNKTLEKLKMNDLSLLILKKQLKSYNYIFQNLKQGDYSIGNSILTELSNKLDALSVSLKEKQKELKIVPFAYLI